MNAQTRFCIYRSIVPLLVCALICATIPQSASASGPKTVRFGSTTVRVDAPDSPQDAAKGQAPIDQKSESAKRPRTTLGKALIGAGIAMMASGAITIAVAPDPKGDPNKLPKGLWQAAGGADLATGVILTLVGLSKLRAKD